MIKTEMISSLSEVNMTDYKYALVYNISDMYFGEAQTCSGIDEEQVAEAFLFDEDKELHIYRESDELRLVRFMESEHAAYDKIDCSYELRQKDMGKKLIVREYLDYDEDGQVYVAFKRMIDIR